MFLWFYISRQFFVFIIASNALLFHLEIFNKKKPFLALKRKSPFGTRHLTSVQTLFYLDFLIFDLCFLIPAVVPQIFNPGAEVVIPTEMPIKEAKPEMETHLVILEITISKWLT